MSHTQGIKPKNKKIKKNKKKIPFSTKISTIMIPRGESDRGKSYNECKQSKQYEIETEISQTFENVLNTQNASGDKKQLLNKVLKINKYYEKKNVTKNQDLFENVAGFA